MGSGVRVGCAGWSLPSRSAAAFPGPGSHLERYAAVFPSAEINSSFYRPHRAATYAKWRDAVPRGFRFSVKLPRRATHELRLREPAPVIAEFMDAAGELGAKLGCLLVQLPPSLAFDPEVAGEFFATLRRLGKAPCVCEPRHASWFTDEAARLLADHGAGCVLADPPPVPGVVPRGDDSLHYVRLHGSPEMYRSTYDEAWLDALAQALRRRKAAGQDVWCIFDNTALGAAVPNALHLLRALDAEPSALEQVAHDHVGRVVEPLLDP